MKVMTKEPLAELLSDTQIEIVCLAGPGATGGVGTRVAKVLLQQGKAVRALVRNEQKARTLLVRQSHQTFCTAVIATKASIKAFQ